MRRIPCLQRLAIVICAACAAIACAQDDIGTYPDFSTAEERAVFQTKEQITQSIRTGEPDRPQLELEYALPWENYFVTLHRGYDAPDQLSIYEQADGKFRLIRRMIFGAPQDHVASYEHLSGVCVVELAGATEDTKIKLLHFREGWKRGSSPVVFYSPKPGEIQLAPYEDAREGYTRLTSRRAYPGHKEGRPQYFLEGRFVGEFLDAGPVTDSEEEEAKKAGYKSAGKVTLTYKLSVISGDADTQVLKLVVAAVHSDLDK